MFACTEHFAPRTIAWRAAGSRTCRITEAPCLDAISPGPAEVSRTVQSVMMCASTVRMEPAMQPDHTPGRPEVPDSISPCALPNLATRTCRPEVTRLDLDGLARRPTARLHTARRHLAQPGRQDRTVSAFVDTESAPAGMSSSAIGQSRCAFASADGQRRAPMVSDVRHSSTMSAGCHCRFL